MRYNVCLRMELWPEAEERGADAAFVFTKDISMRGVYFLDDREHVVGAKLNFSVIFLREFTGEDADLISGVGRVVRCEHLPVRDPLHFGVAIDIERTTHLHVE